MKKYFKLLCFLVLLAGTLPAIMPGKKSSSDRYPIVSLYMQDNLNHNDMISDARFKLIKRLLNDYRFTQAIYELNDFKKEVTPVTGLFIDYWIGMTFMKIGSALRDGRMVVTDKDELIYKYEVQVIHRTEREMRLVRKILNTKGEYYTKMEIDAIEKLSGGRLAEDEEIDLLKYKGGGEEKISPVEEKSAKKDDELDLDLEMPSDGEDDLGEGLDDLDMLEGDGDALELDPLGAEVPAKDTGAAAPAGGDADILDDMLSESGGNGGKAAAAPAPESTGTDSGDMDILDDFIDNPEGSGNPETSAVTEDGSGEAEELLADDGLGALDEPGLDEGDALELEGELGDDAAAVASGSSDDEIDTGEDEESVADYEFSEVGFDGKDIGERIPGDTTVTEEEKVLLPREIAALKYYEKAIEYFNKLIEMGVDNPYRENAVIKKAEVFKEMGRDVLAVEEYNIFLQAFPYSKKVIDVLIAKGNLMAEQKRYRQALGMFQEILEIFPETEKRSYVKLKIAYLRELLAEKVSEDRIRDEKTRDLLHRIQVLEGFENEIKKKEDRLKELERFLD